MWAGASPAHLQVHQRHPLLASLAAAPPLAALTAAPGTTNGAWLALPRGRCVLEVAVHRGERALVRIFCSAPAAVAHPQTLACPLLDARESRLLTASGPLRALLQQLSALVTDHSFYAPPEAALAQLVETAQQLPLSPVDTLARVLERVRHLVLADGEGHAPTPSDAQPLPPQPANLSLRRRAALAALLEFHTHLLASIERAINSKTGWRGREGGW